jgi:hypothetical protein
LPIEQLNHDALLPLVPPQKAVRPVLISLSAFGSFLNAGRIRLSIKALRGIALARGA